MFFHFYEFYFRISFKNLFVKFFKKDCTKRSNLFILYLIFMLEVCVGNHRPHHLRLLLPRQRQGKEEHLK